MPDLNTQCCKYRRLGHYANDCTGGDKGSCSHCEVVGHINGECPKKHLKKLHSTLPYKPGSETKDNKDDKAASSRNHCDDMEYEG